MAGARISPEELQTILSKPGYGIAGITSTIKSAIGAGSIKSEISGSGSLPDAECRIRHAPVCTQNPSFHYTGRVRIRVKVFRKRLADPDGNVPKWHVDAIRMSRLVKDDSAKEVDYYFEGQEKVEREDQERVEITLEYTDAWFE